MCGRVNRLFFVFIFPVDAQNGASLVACLLVVVFFLMALVFCFSPIGAFFFSFLLLSNANPLPVPLLAAGGRLFSYLPFSLLSSSLCLSNFLSP